MYGRFCSEKKEANPFSSGRRSCAYSHIIKGQCEHSTGACILGSLSNFSNHMEAGHHNDRSTFPVNVGIVHVGIVVIM